MDNEKNFKDTISVYDENAQTYHDNTKDRDFSQVWNSFEKGLKTTGGKKILDLGCGPGRDAKHFTEQGYEVTGIDASEGQIKIAREYCPAANFVKGDMRKLPFPDNSFDGVFSCASILHMEKSQLPLVLNEIKRVLKDNGVVFIKTKEADKEPTLKPSRSIPEKNIFWVYYTEQELRNILEDHGFEIIDFFKQHIVVHWINFLCKLK